MRFNATEIKEAIERSVSHTEIAQVEVRTDFETIYSQVSAITDECDYREEDNGDWDVYGTTEDGSEFRLRFVHAR